METRYSRDDLDLDDQVRDAFDERPGKPLRIRVQPTILRTTSEKSGHFNQHQPWKGVRWILDVETVEEAAALREALRVFFAQVSELGPETLLARLLGKEVTP